MNMIEICLLDGLDESDTTIAHKRTGELRLFQDSRIV